MYKHLKKEDFKSILKLPQDYKVDGLLVFGTHPKEKEYVNLYEALGKTGLQFHEEKIEDGFFRDIKVFIINGKRFWFDVVYGTAYLSEVTHIACLFGSRLNILIGSCGGLQENLNMCDVIIPLSSYGNESSTRMYQRDEKENVYYSDKQLNKEIKSRIDSKHVVHEGSLVTV